MVLLIRASLGVLTVTAPPSLLAPVSKDFDLFDIPLSFLVSSVSTCLSFDSTCIFIACGQTFVLVFAQSMLNLRWPWEVS